MSTILWLEEIDRASLADAGGKGANLGEMVRAGLPVPPGFVITAAAYRRHIAIGGLNERITARLAGLNYEDMAAVEQACSEIGAWIAGAAMPPEVAEQTAAAYRRLANGGPSPGVAVRSSATAEDLPDASFAGQQDTYLGVRGEEAVLDAVRRCWASLWTPRAAAYRARMGYDHQAVSLAVVVQAMVPAEVAGVMFTANPLSGSAGEFVVTAAYGYGEAVVSGLVTPDTFVLGAQGGVKERTLGTKEQQVVPNTAGTRTEAVEPARRSRFCLSDADLGRLADLGRRVTAHYGAPQDTEWAMAGGQLYLLQARPITVATPGYVGPKLNAIQLRSAAAAADNNLDHWPEPLTPLDGAMYRVATGGLGQWMRELGINVPPDRSYYEELPDGRIAIRPLAPMPRLPMLWRMPGRFLRGLREAPDAAWPTLRADLLNVIEPLQQTDVAALETPALAVGISRVLAALERAMRLRFSSMFTSGSLFEGLTGVWSRLALGKEAGADTVRLLFTSLPHSTAEMNRAVADLARTAAEYGRESAAFDRQLAAFLEQWGSRPTRGMEALPSVPNWRDDATAVMGLVDAIRCAPALMDSAALERRRAAEYAAARDRISARLNPLFRRWFAHSVEMARRFIVVREESHLLYERACAQIRRLALELGRRLAAAGRIAAAEDIFFLLETELGPAARAELDVRDRIARRRRAYQQVLAAHRRGENWFVASGSLPPEAIPRRAPVREGILRGIAASRGRVTGNVCIVRDQSEFGKLKKGDILVAPLTAPAWTPLFGVAAAVVTDVGGPLSHAAIVAREYGIPAVLGAGKATSLLQDGQQVTVDGTAGVVTA